VAGASPGVAFKPRFPGCLLRLGKALAIGRNVGSDGYRLRGRQALVSGVAWRDLAGPLIRSVVMVTLAAIAILVLLPAAIAAQGTLSV
jgi:hypothetical protein